MQSARVSLTTTGVEVTAHWEDLDLPGSSRTKGTGTSVMSIHLISLGLPTSHDAKKLGPSTSSSIPRTLQRTGTNHRSSGERGAGNGITRLGSSVQTMKSLPIPQLFPLSSISRVSHFPSPLSLSLSLLPLSCLLNSPSLTVAKSSFSVRICE